MHARLVLAMNGAEFMDSFPESGLNNAVDFQVSRALPASAEILRFAQDDSDQACRSDCSEESQILMAATGAW
jgi:hypothetical protein